MKIFISHKTSPYYNLSIEELMAQDEQIKGDILYLYQHDNAVIIGRNQNAHEEIKRDYVEENKIELARRLSGGGAVYHDLGNINFSFITDYDHKGGYERFLAPIIDYLNSLGLKAEFKGRNDLLCNGAKISGNAQYIKGNRIVSHGTLLFDVDLTKLSNALNPSKLKIESKGIQSARQRVTNIAKELNYSLSTNEFINKLVEYFVQNDHGQIEEIPVERYKIEKNLDNLIAFRKTDEWIYGKNPKFSFENAAKFPNGILKIKANVEKDKFTEVYFEGDFLAKKELNDSNIYQLFKGLSFTRESVAKVLEQIDLDMYFGGISKEEILSLFFPS
ncbi:lipoate--protein ligase [Mycoplasmopsis sturni]|uniref:lipoate--protein ligase n=1 Tax=Mycoplasmopsis sturni TaxID=39047 RepID=UPI00055BD598|nr:lipoate--protein ligase [Mycoplasmopsis sturni]